ncbi:hypothetical protein PA598K_06932, partial [Paenibacillus sp. 598K]
DRLHRRTYYDGAGPAMKAVYGQVRGEHASPLGKLLRGRRGKLFLSSLVTIGAVLLVLSFVLQDKGGDGETPVPGTPGAGGTTGESPAQGETDPGTTTWPDMLVYAVQPGADEPSAHTQLELLFRVPAACAELDAEELGSFVLETPDGKMHVFRNMSFEAACGGNTAPDGSGAGNGSDSDAGAGDDNTSGSGTDTEVGGTSGSGTRNGSTSGSGSEGGSGAGSRAEGGSTGGANSASNNTNRAATTDSDSETSGSVGTDNEAAPEDSTDKSATNGGGASGSTGPQGTDGSVPEADMTLEEIYPARIVIALGERLELPEGTILRFDTRSYELSAAPEQEETPPVETESENP